MKEEKRDPRLLRTGMFAGLKFDDGWWFIQTIGREYNEVKPVTLLNEDEDRDEIAPGTEGVTTDEIEDSQDRNILEPSSSQRNLVFQVLYGIAPSRFQVFELYGRERNNAVQDFDSPGDPAAYITGFDSPYNNPSRESELFTINSMAPLRLQAFNPTDTAAEAKLSFHVNKLRYTTVTDKDLMKAMLQGQQPARLQMMGGGAQNKDQIGIPTWVDEAFGEHIYTTKEILSNGNSDNGDNVPKPAAELERNGGA